MRDSFRQSVAEKFEVAAEAAGAVFSFSGTVVAILFGKVLLAIALGAITLGLFFRLTSRRSKASRDGLKLSRVPKWTTVVAAVLSLAESAAWLEATNLPVRFSQPGFAFHHWAWGIAFPVVAYAVQRRLLVGFFRRRGKPPAF